MCSAPFPAIYDLPLFPHFSLSLMNIGEKSLSGRNPGQICLLDLWQTDPVSPPPATEESAPDAPQLRAERAAACRGPSGLT